MERVCVECGGIMQPVKNSFHFVTKAEDGYVGHTSDLWGCRRCKRFQIHGSPKAHYPMAILEEGELIEDPGNSSMLAVIRPKFRPPSEFQEHMDKWYSRFCYPEGWDETVIFEKEVKDEQKETE